MPTKKKAKSSTRRRRTSSAVSTIRRRASSGFHRVSHKARGIMPQNWGAKLLYGLAGYMTPGVIQDLGLMDTVYQMASRSTSPIAQGLKTAMDNAYQIHGTNYGQFVGKTAGLAMVLHSLHKHKNSSSSPITNEFAFGLGALADDPTQGYTSGYAGSGGTNGYWTN